MNIMTLNIRGMGDSHKVDRACRLRRSQNLILMVIQETQLNNLQRSLDTSRCWGNDNHGFDFVNAVGRLGGLLTVWDSTFFNIKEMIKSRYFLVTIGTCPSIVGLLAIVNVYGP